MKKLLRIFALIALLTAMPAYAAKNPGSKVGVEFAATSFDFGTVSEDKGYVVHEYAFDNTGDGAVAIVSVVASCGCTRPEYTRKPVAQGKTGKIKVTFNTRGQKGEVNKDIKVRLRSADGKSERVTLHLNGVVVPKTE